MKRGREGKDSIFKGERERKGRGVVLPRNA